MKALHWIRKKSANFFRKKTVAPCPYRACTVRTFKSGCTVRTLSRLPYVVLILSKRAGPATPSSMTLKNFHYVKYCFFSQDEIDEGSIWKTFWWHRAIHITSGDLLRLYSLYSMAWSGHSTRNNNQVTSKAYLASFSRKGNRNRLVEQEFTGDLCVRPLKHGKIN